MSEDLQLLIQKRRAEAQAEQARVAQQQDRERHQRQRRQTAVTNFQSSVGAWLTSLMLNFNSQLPGVAELRRDARDNWVRLNFRKAGGGGSCGQAWITFSIDQDDCIRWKSDLNAIERGSKPKHEITFGFVRSVVQQFLTAALA
jgi:hypothetical protein